MQMSRRNNRNSRHFLPRLKWTSEAWGLDSLLVLFFPGETEEEVARYDNLRSGVIFFSSHYLMSALTGQSALTRQESNFGRNNGSIMSLLKSILGKRKFLSTSMFRWHFLKKIFQTFFFFCDEMELPYLYLTAR